MPTLIILTAHIMKLPTAKVAIGKKNRERFSALVEEARAQLLEYRDWFEDAGHRRKIRDRFGMEIYRPSALSKNDPTLLSKSDPPPPSVGWVFCREAKAVSCLRAGVQVTSH